MIETLIWIGIYFGIAFIISRLLPFPISLIVIVFAVIGLGLFRRRRSFRKTDQASSTGSSYFGNMFGSQRGINYYCMNCGTRHNQLSCPNCGSKLKKAGFWWKSNICRTEHLKALGKHAYALSSYHAFIHKYQDLQTHGQGWKICEDRVKKNPISIALILTLSIPEGHPLEGQKQLSLHYKESIYFYRKTNEYW